jgi:hypothetical protein
MSPIEYRDHEWGRRCYVFGKRLHHFTAGLAMVLFAAAWRRRFAVIVAGVGALLMADDWEDAVPRRVAGRWRALTDDCNHERRATKI